MARALVATPRAMSSAPAVRSEVAHANAGRMPAMSSAAAVRSEVAAQTTALLYRNAPLAQGVTIALASLLAYAGHGLRPQAALFWWSAIVAIAIVRLAIARRFGACADKLDPVWSRSLLAIIDDILDFSRIDAGKLALDATDFDPAAALRAALKPFQLQATAKGLRFAVACGRGVPERVRGDPGRLRQVVVNLVGNALKFTPSGEVAVALESLGEQDGRAVLRYSVRDTGIGIAPDKQAHVFEAFTQEDGSTTRRYGGTGLGLTISQQLVRLMGGEITLASQPGAGSVFSFSVALPLAADSGDLPQFQ